MPETNFIAELLELKDVIVTKIENAEEGKHIYLELPRKVHKCPECCEETDRVHDYREQKIKDIPYLRNTFLHFRKRRYICLNCGKRFYEQNDFLPRYHRSTQRLITTVMEEFRMKQPASQIAKRYNISSTTAFRYFDQISYGAKHLPEVLSIDEFKGDADGEKYQCILTNPKKKLVIDVLKNRREMDLIDYFRNCSDRNNVRYFITDMNPHFRNVAQVCFPNATIIADRYHVSRQVCWAMENVRKNEQKKFSKTHRRYFKRSRYLLMKNPQKLTKEDEEDLAHMFELAPRLARAYDLKNKFLDVMHSKDSKEGSRLLSQWFVRAELEGLDEFKACITAYHNWSKEILNALDCKWSNGYTEGCNNRTKVLKRVCFGIRKFSRLRNRIMHCCA